MRLWGALSENLGNLIVSVACKFAIYGQILDFLASYERLVPSLQHEVYRIVRLDWLRNSQLTYEKVSVIVIICATTPSAYFPLASIGYASRKQHE